MAIQVDISYIASATFMVAIRLISILYRYCSPFTYSLFLYLLMIFPEIHHLQLLDVIL